MKINSPGFWNQFLLRFIVAFSFWEVLGFPFRLVFFSKFYNDDLYRNFFVSVQDIYWPVPILAESVFVFFLGLLIQLSRHSLPEGISGGFVFGLIFSVCSYFSAAVFFVNFTQISSAVIWVWALYSAILTIIVSGVYTIGVENSEDD
ncbi:MAG: hypothetical protein K8R21_09080 [Leptospira sp.]|nr:hypothetical protein [Leptospira sp.]